MTLVSYFTVDVDGTLKKINFNLLLVFPCCVQGNAVLENITLLEAFFVPEEGQTINNSDLSPNDCLALNRKEK